MRRRNEKSAEQKIANHPFCTKKYNIAGKIEIQAIKLTKMSSLGGTLQRQFCGDTTSHKNVKSQLLLQRKHSG